MASTSIVWLRNDLRIADNPALSAAVRAGDRVVALYVHEQTPGVRPPGATARWWLHHSLLAIEKDLAARGIELEIRAGDSTEMVVAAAMHFKADAVFWNRRYAPGEQAVDTEIKTTLRAAGAQVESFGANVLVEPWDIATGQGRPYSVFSPFFRTLRGSEIVRTLPRPPSGTERAAKAVDEDYSEPRWAGKLGQYWQIGEAGAHKALADFLDHRLDGYAVGRDFPARDVTSRLSPHLRSGEISPRQIWHAAMHAADAQPERRSEIEKFLSELAWRDFGYHQLYHRPDIVTQPMQPKYGGMAWRNAPKDLERWQRGQTGFPIVDAGMRELWETGYMQNRVRMLVASLLTKNLLVDWHLGEEWFWDCLVDGDIASNPSNWQWVAGCGLDAAPYFRVFNPVTQGGRFDEDGAYVRHWVPEVAQLPDKWVHEPGTAPADVLKKADIVLGKSYPSPIVDLKTSRVRALDALADLAE